MRGREAGIKHTASSCCATPLLLCATRPSPTTNLPHPPTSPATNNEANPPLPPTWPPHLSPYIQ
jgi:hypothetical protein